ncbi:MAG: Fur family transcriptional regulator [Culicoidibacterales bacterium]
MILAEYIERTNIRMTEKRKLMLEFFYREKRYANAKEVKEYLKNEYGLEVSNDFVYTNLQLFVENKLLQEFIENQERQFFFSEVNGHYAICTVCHRVTPIEMVCPVHQIGNTYGKVQSHRFEMFVICPLCLA